MWVVFFDLPLELGISLGLGFVDGGGEGVSRESDSVISHAVKVCESGEGGFCGVVLSFASKNVPVALAGFSPMVWR